jgi:hypothetical protein
MSEPCFLSPPAGAGRRALEEHLETLRAMNQNDPLVQMAIEETKRSLEALREK